MENSLVVALIITAIGMTLLFLALAFFYGLLSLMMAVIKDRPAAGVPLAVGNGGEPVEQDARLRAAAIAVALARAEAEQGAGLASTGGVSPWWALHHQRQLTLNPNTRRVR